MEVEETRKMEVEVRIKLKHGVADPEGENTKKALNLLGFRNVRAVETMKTFRIVVEEEAEAGEGGGEEEGREKSEEERVRQEVEEMCRRLLANPVIQDYEIAVVARNCEDFQNAVWNLTQKIPKGRVTTYGEISRKITGCSTTAPQAVGQALAKNPKPGSGEGEIPCHRVVKKGGEVGEGVKNQIDLLRAEGVTINKETKKGGKVVNFKDVFFPAKGEKW